MTTLLWFDDLPLNRRDNVARHLGQPRLLPESIYHDPVANTAWAYPTVWRDEASGRWRMLYLGIVAHGQHLPLIADSADGLRWQPYDTTTAYTLPDRMLVNQVDLPLATFGEWSQPYWDEQAPVTERFKGLVVRSVNAFQLQANLWVSADGLHWVQKEGVHWQEQAPDPPTSVCWNAGRHSYVFSSRPSFSDRRIALFETRDWEHFTPPQLAMAADALDTPLAEIYGMPIFAYEQYFVAFLWLYHVAPQVMGQSPHKFFAGHVDCQLAYSLNGSYFQRLLHQPFIANGTPEQPHYGCVYPTALLVLSDGTLRIYAGASQREHGYRTPGEGAIIAFDLRRDGFVYLESMGSVGTIGTRPLLWCGGELELNVQSQAGQVRVQVTTPDGTPCPGYTFADCRPFAGDSTSWVPQWVEGMTLAQMTGHPLRVEVELTSARLYALRGDFQMLTAADVGAVTDGGLTPRKRVGFF